MCTNYIEILHLLEQHCCSDDGRANTARACTHTENKEQPRFNALNPLAFGGSLKPLSLGLALSVALKLESKHRGLLRSKPLRSLAPYEKAIIKLNP